MATPAIKVCTKNTWVIVATAVAAGQVHIMTTAGSGGEHLVYLHTYRDTGGVAPTLQSEGIPLVGLSHQIEATANVDVYIMCTGAAGSVRVDL